MASPYRMDVNHNCTTCTNRKGFCDMPSQSVAAMERIKFTAMYPKGALLFVEGERPRGVFVLCSGKVKLTTSSSEGRTLIVRLAEAGEILGASAVLLHRAYEISAETIEPCQVNFIRTEEFMSWVQNDRDAMMSVARQLSGDYYAAQREIRAFGLAQTTSEKLARLVLDWCDESGERTDKGIRLKVLLTHEEIAQMIGTTRETVTRLLTSLRTKKVIEVKGSTVNVVRPDALEAMVTV
ncbi:MAG TPA: Crp/Fnr family transcriptional regulator [Thermoanaerobaculia bacterium]|nr:Crp/Fnr family transcriptional regulator [Thermoanaerobaculia bacterium]